MIGLASDKDTSYFSVLTDDPSIAGSIAPEHVLSLTVTEEAEKIPSGRVQLLDPYNVYSKILRRNTPLTVRWGYKKSGVDPLSIGGASLDFFSPQVDRRGFKAIVQDVDGAANEQGVYTFNAGFQCRDFRGVDESKLYGVGGGMTKGAVIAAVLLEVQPAALVDVNFQGMNDQIPKEGERRDETQFRYLCRKSQEWHAVFRMGWAADGTLCAVFLDPSKLANSAVVAKLAAGKSALNLKYATGSDGNVISYTWKTADGENGQGDNVRIELVNGQYQFQHYQADTEQVVTWVLDETKVQAAMEAAGTIDRKLFLTEQVAAATKFSDVQKYFRPVESSTAPNGYGYTVNCRLFGSIFAAPPVLVSFDAGFPPCLTTKSGDAARLAAGALSVVGVGGTPRQNTFYLRSATHNLSSGGYFTDIECVDAYIMWGAVGLQ